MTYRERREKRAEKRREWGDSREAKSEAAFEKARGIADGIPFGQPILVGHHSEGRARRDQERIVSGMSAGVENARAAERHVEAADEIERQLRTSIYSDDPDAVERLQERIAELEAKRDRIKAENAAFRKEHRAELKAMGAYDRDQAIPHPSYELTNLSGNIARQKKRLAQLQAPERARRIVARFDSTCDECGSAIAKGEAILYFKRSRRAIHEACRPTSKSAPSEGAGLEEALQEAAGRGGPEAFALVREIDRVADLYRIVEAKEAGLVENYWIDVFTASALIQVWERLSDANKEKFGRLPLPRLVDFAMSRVAT